jgi:hydroxymethylpyrimidine/phosphomethylpyrimidine kinase
VTRRPRRPAPDERPVALTVAGSDSGGGAGIQADLATMAALGVFGTSAITSVTAQNTRGVESTHVLPVGEVDAQVGAVREDFDVRAVKTGMLATARIVERVADHAADWDVPFVVDPVMVAASGDRLLEPAAESAYEALVAAATLVTPNADEAELLAGVDVDDEAGMRAAGEALVDAGADAALVKGGHVEGDADPGDGHAGGVVDLLVTGEGVQRFTHPRVDSDATHGSGCTLSSAIAAELARGRSLAAAVAGGVDLVHRAVRYPLAVGRGPGAVHGLAGLRERAGRTATAEATERVVDRLVGTDGAAALVPDRGLNVAGATRYAETVDEVAAVEGRVARTRGGVRPNRGVRFGAADRLARTLLAAREADPALRFAAVVRHDDAVAAALSASELRAVTADRAGADGGGADPGRGSEVGGRVDAVARAVGDAGLASTPVAVVDPAGVGRESTATLLAADAGALGEELAALATAVDGQD